MQANGRRGILSVLRVWSLSNGSLERLEEAIAAAGGMPWAIAVALWWLLPAGGAPVGLGGVPFACEVGRFACGSGACGACWATFSQRSGADVSRVWSVWNVEAGVARVGLLGYLLPAELGGRLEGLERLERRGPCGACWGTFCLRSWAFCMREWAELGGRLEGLERLRPVKRQPGTPIRSHCCGRGGCLEPLLWPCGGFCLRAWRLLGLLGLPFCLRSWAFCMRE